MLLLYHPIDETSSPYRDQTGPVLLPEMADGATIQFMVMVILVADMAMSGAGILLIGGGRKGSIKALDPFHSSVVEAISSVSWNHARMA